MTKPIVRRVCAAAVIGLLASTASAADRVPAGPLKALTGGHLPSVSTLQPLLADAALGTSVDASVVDASSGKVLLDQSAEATVIPASPLKILTAVAALSVLGPSHQITTSVLASDKPVQGVLHGDLYLRGAGDPTLSAGRYQLYPPPATLDELAARVAHAGIRSVLGRVVYDTSLFSGPLLAPGWRDTYVLEGSVAPVSALEVDEGRSVGNPIRGPRSQQPAADAGAAFVEALQRAGVRLANVAQPGVVSAAAHPVASVSSAPLRELVERMLTESDNDLAECLGRLLAVATGRPTTFSGAADSVVATLGSLGLPLPSGAHLNDTSGLSRDDLITPAYLTSLVRLITLPQHANLRAALTGFPVAAASGTLAKRFRGLAMAGAGVVRAKTGSLTGVSSLVGTVVTKGRRLLIFAVIAQAAPSRAGAEAALDRFAAALADLP